MGVPMGSVGPLMGVPMGSVGTLMGVPMGSVGPLMGVPMGSVGTLMGVPMGRGPGARAPKSALIWSTLSYLANCYRADLGAWARARAPYPWVHP